jgi:hypothetical protein
MLATLARWAGALRPLRAVAGPAPQGERPALDYPALRSSAAAAVDRLVADLQAGADGADRSGFSEMTLYVLVERDGTWWLAAGQNTPVTTPPPP